MLTTSSLEKFLTHMYVSLLSSKPSYHSAMNHNSISREENIFPRRCPSPEIHVYSHSTLRITLIARSKLWTVPLIAIPRGPQTKNKHTEKKEKRNNEKQKKYIQWTHPDVYDSGDWDANDTWRRSIVADDKRNAATLYHCLRGGPALLGEGDSRKCYIDELILKMFATAWT